MHPLSPQILRKLSSRIASKIGKLHTERSRARFFEEKSVLSIITLPITSVINFPNPRQEIVIITAKLDQERRAQEERERVCVCKQGSDMLSSFVTTSSSNALAQSSLVLFLRLFFRAECEACLRSAIIYAKRMSSGRDKFQTCLVFVLRDFPVVCRASDAALHLNNTAHIPRRWELPPLY